jgi:uncharacterized protein YecE (DUF72 family)
MTIPASKEKVKAENKRVDIALCRTIRETAQVPSLGTQRGWRVRALASVGHESSPPIPVLTLPCPSSAVPRMESSAQARLRQIQSNQIQSNQVQSKSVHSNDIRIGTAGWSYKDWDGIFYPSGMSHRKQHPLEYLARFFDTTEINTSFYGPLKPEWAKLWCRKVAAVNKNFLFTAKLYRAFTHSPVAVMEPTSAATIRPTDEDEIRTREGLDAIASEGRLGALLIQFPVSFKNTSLNREYLDRLLRQFIEYPRVVEVRHSSWNDAETLAAFTQKDVGFCNIDQPLLGRSLAPTEHVTAAIGYVRLHGRNYEQWFADQGSDSDRRNDRYNYLYNERELAGWKERIDSVAERALTTYVITNNHFESKAGVNALELKAMISGKRVLAPPTLIQKYPELRSIADPAEDFGIDFNPKLPLRA